MKNIQLTVIGVLASVFILSSCGNVDIVKRRHMPGYHVEITKKHKHEKPDSDKTATSKAKQEMDAVDVREAQVNRAEEKEDEVLTASASPQAPALTKEQRKTKRKEAIDHAVDVTMTTFRQELSATKRALKPSPASDVHWMAWVAFGAGIGSAFLGFLGLILAIFGFAIWAPAIVFGVAAIVFAIIHAKNGYGGEKFRRLGLLFGIIGASLGLIGLIIWAIRIARVFVV